AEHHRWVVARDVVAVRDVAAVEGSEVADERDLLAAVEHDDIFLPDVVELGAGDDCGPPRRKADWYAVARNDPVLLLMDVHRVPPSAAALDRPHLGPALARQCQRLFDARQQTTHY